MTEPAEVLQSTPIVDEEILKDYVEVKKQIKTLETKAELLNKTIKNKLGQFVLDSISELLGQHKELVDSYIAAVEYEDAVLCAELSEELAVWGISSAMIQEYQANDRLKILQTHKLDLEIEGYQVKTLIQDRSKINQDRAVAFLKCLNRKDLVKKVEVVDEAALEIAIYNGELKPQEVQKACVDPQFVVTMTVK